MKLLALLLAALVPATALAGSPGHPAADPEIQKLHREIAAAKLDRTLNLSKEQAKALLPALKEVGQLREQRLAEKDRRRADQIRALTAVRDDYLRTGTVSDASRKALEDARGGALRSELRAKMKALHGKVREVLTVEQMARLKDFSPSPLERGAGMAERERDPDFDDDGEAGPGRHGRGKHGGHGKPRMILRTAVTPEFISLVENRAR